MITKTSKSPTYSKGKGHIKSKKGVLKEKIFTIIFIYKKLVLNCCTYPLHPDVRKIRPYKEEKYTPGKKYRNDKEMDILSDLHLDPQALFR